MLCSVLCLDHCVSSGFKQGGFVEYFFVYIYFTINTNDLLSDYENKYLFMLWRLEFSCVRIGHLIPNMMFS